MKAQLILLLIVSVFAVLLTDSARAMPSIAEQENSPSSSLSDVDQTKSDVVVNEQFIRKKRAPIHKLPLLLGGALVAKKALLLGGAAVGAGIAGVGYHTARHIAAGTGHGYAASYSGYVGPVAPVAPVAPYWSGSASASASYVGHAW